MALQLIIIWKRFIKAVKSGLLPIYPLPVPLLIYQQVLVD